MHRWIWDLHYAAPVSTRHEYPIAAIAHDTPRYPLGPTALPGTYTVRLSVDGKTSTASLTVKMDPRVKAPAAELQRKFESEKKLAAIVSDIAQASLQAGSLRAQIEKINPATASQTKDAISTFQKKLDAILGGGGGFFAPPSEEVTLARVSGAAGTLYQQVWQANAAPTSAQAMAIESTSRESADVLKRWAQFKTSELPSLNQLLRQSKVPEIEIQPDFNQEDADVNEE